MEIGKRYVSALLIGLLVAVSLFSQEILAQGNTSSLEQKARSLLPVLEKLNATATSSLSELAGSSSPATDQAKQQYLLGNGLAQQAFDYWKKGDFQAAISAALVSMTTFQRVLKLASEDPVSKSSSELAVSAERAISLEAGVERAGEYLSRVENLSLQAENFGFNVSEIGALLNQTRLTLESASSIISSDADGAEMLLSTARVMIGKIEVLQVDLAAQMEIARTQSYVANAEERLDILRGNITSAISIVPTSAQSASIAALNQAQLNLTAAKNYLVEGKTNETIAALVNFRAQEQQSIKILQANGIAVPSQLADSTSNTATTVRPTSTPSLGSTSNAGTATSTTLPRNSSSPTTNVNVTSSNLSVP